MALPSWLRDHDVLALDTETSGLDPVADRVLQLGAAHFLAGKLLRAGSRYCNPRVPIPVEVSKVNGITEETVRDAPHFASAMSLLTSDLGPAFKRPGMLVIAHNVEFDSAFLRFEAARVQLTDWPRPELCTMALAKALAGVGRYRSGFRLVNLCAQAGIDFEGIGPHDARSDAIACGRLLYHLAPQLPDTLHGVLALQYAWYRDNPRDPRYEAELEARRALGGNAA